MQSLFKVFHAYLYNMYILRNVLGKLIIFSINLEFLTGFPLDVPATHIVPGLNPEGVSDDEYKISKTFDEIPTFRLDPEDPATAAVAALDDSLSSVLRQLAIPADIPKKDTTSGLKEQVNHTPHLRSAFDLEDMNTNSSEPAFRSGLFAQKSDSASSKMISASAKEIDQPQSGIKMSPALSATQADTVPIADEPPAFRRLDNIKTELLERIKQKDGYKNVQEATAIPVLVGEPSLERMFPIQTNQNSPQEVQIRNDFSVNNENARPIAPEIQASQISGDVNERSALESQANLDELQEASAFLIPYLNILPVPSINV